MSNFLLPRFPPSIDPGVEKYPGIATGWQDDPGISISSDFTGDPGISRAPGIGPDGLLSGLPEVPEPGPTDGYGLQLLMSPEQISTIDWQSPRPDGGQGDEIARLTIGQAAKGNSVTGGSDSGGTPAPGPKSPIGPIKGYPETGKDAWRAANDDAITGATAKYNSDNGYQPGDPRYVSPGLMKSWMMQESGGSRHAFETDPFQVNNPRDWPKYDEKTKYAGLSKGQAMTPQTSADAALKWLQYKGSVHDTQGDVTSYRGHRDALMGYNGRTDIVGGIPFRQGYADSILTRARDSYGDDGQN